MIVYYTIAIYLHSAMYCGCSADHIYFVAYLLLLLALSSLWHQFEEGLHISVFVRCPQTFGHTVYFSLLQEFFLRWTCFFRVLHPAMVCSVRSGVSCTCLLLNLVTRNQLSSWTCEFSKAYETWIVQSLEFTWISWFNEFCAKLVLFSTQCVQAERKSSVELRGCPAA